MMTLNTVWNSLYHTSSRQGGGRGGNRISVMEVEWMQSKQILGCPKLSNTSRSHMGPTYSVCSIFSSGMKGELLHARTWSLILEIRASGLRKQKGRKKLLF